MGRALTASRSLWQDTAPPSEPRPALDGDAEYDVAVVGGGFTGLWTAYYLLRAEPSLRVVVLEAETVGFGASGGNSGWCSALFPTSLPGMHDALVDTLDEIEAVLAAERIDAHFRRGGTIAEHTRVLELEPRTVRTDRGVITADVVVRATEGYTSGLPGHRRDLAPVYSLVVATEPLAAATWAEIARGGRDLQRPPPPHRLRPAHC